MRYLLSYDDKEGKSEGENFKLSFHDYDDAIDMRAQLIKQGAKNVHVYKEIVTYERLC